MLHRKTYIYEEEEKIFHIIEIVNKPFSLLICLVQTLEAGWLLRLRLDLLLYILAAQRLLLLESVPVKKKLYINEQFPLLGMDNTCNQPFSVL